MGADRPQVADQRPILGPEPATQRDEPGNVGIRQISTPSGSSRQTAYGRPIMRSVWQLERACIKLELRDERITELGVVAPKL
jgi:hypothetical protein